jgi:hypothetical protein
MSERNLRRGDQQIGLSFPPSLPEIRGIGAIETDRTKLEVLYRTLYWIQEIVVGMRICPPLVGALEDYRTDDGQWKYEWAEVLKSRLITLEVHIQTSQPNPQKTEEEKREEIKKSLSSAIFDWLNRVYKFSR